MKKQILFSLLVSLSTHLLAAPGDWQIGVKNDSGQLVARNIALANGQVLGQTGGLPAALTPFSGAWSALTGLPTTLAGYGITDGLTAATAAATYEPLIGAGTLALSKLATDPLVRANHIGTQAWSTLTGLPTTLAGYGITDGLTAATAAATYEPLIGAGTLALSKLATDPLVRANHIGTQAWSTLTDLPTTLADYGITDAAPKNNPAFTGTFRAASASSAGGAAAVAIGAAATAGGLQAVAIGPANTASASNSVVIGDNNTAGSAPAVFQTFIWGTNISATPQSGNRANMLLGRNHSLTSSTHASSSLTTGSYGVVRHSHERIFANGEFMGVGTAQAGEVFLTTTTTNTSSPQQLYIDHTTAGRAFTLLAGQAYDCFIRVIARRADGAAHASYWRRAVIQRTASTTSLLAAVQTIGTDYETDASWNVSIAADDSNDRLRIDVTGTASHTIRWVAHIYFVEINH